MIWWTLLFFQQRACAYCCANLWQLCDMPSLTPYKLSGVWSNCGCPGFLSFTYPSGCHIDTDSIVARRITSWKLLLETTLYSCNRLCFDKQFQCPLAALHCSVLHFIYIPDIPVFDGSQYGNAAWQPHWFSNLKSQWGFLVNPVCVCVCVCVCRIIYWKLCINLLMPEFSGRSDI